MKDAGPEWGEFALDMAHTREEAARRFAEWEQRAQAIPGAEVRVTGWRDAGGGETYLLWTRSEALVRRRPGGLFPSAGLIAHWRAAHVRHLDFTLRPWRDRPALRARGDLPVYGPYVENEPYDPERWELVPNAWDHEHCLLCDVHICADGDHGYTQAYFSAGPAHFDPNGDEVWICPPCFARYLHGWQRLPIDETA